MTTTPAEPDYAAPSYQPYPTALAPAQTRVSDTNTYALVSVILAFMVPIAGIIFGHMGLSQIKRTGDAGRGLALTAVIYGYTVTVLGFVFIVSYIGFIAMMIGAVASQGSY